MIENKLDAIIYIGRFQPPTKAHFQTIKNALDTALKLIVIVGSAKRARSVRDPFTCEERISMLSKMEGIDQKRITYIPVVNSDYNFPIWIKDIQEKAARRTLSKDVIGIIGHEKDQSSYYLNYFPQWKFIKQDNLCGGLSATNVRDSYFSGKDYKNNDGLLKSTASFLAKFAKTQDYKKLKAEYDFIKQYKELWSKAPYPVTFSTADSLVLCKGHVLLIKRGFNPGKGLLALPGGFISQNETFTESALRELKEETKIDIDKNILRNSIKLQQIFDDPYRDLRGRFITQVSLIDLKVKDLPKVKAADDANQARWTPLGELEEIRDKFFADHYQIIKHLLNKI
ncbi:MAG: bifunctional nicotinamide-nucleotide adenylyltransferase/Nudix hydroxylase [Endomicrobium sp.]|jgi:bifunctional NMN adenylyltransferase/nudix hydrolase|nr:bifunctional nicotinamide-nucleotide adenylyltransferase/Nudix hydroxylase [Endomicrobium sp.]